MRLPGISKKQTKGFWSSVALSKKYLDHLCEYMLNREHLYMLQKDSQ